MNKQPDMGSEKQRVINQRESGGHKPDRETDYQKKKHNRKKNAAIVFSYISTECDKKMVRF